MFDPDGISDDKEFDWFSNADDEISHDIFAPIFVSDIPEYESLEVNEKPFDAQQRETTFIEISGSETTAIFSSVYEDLCGRDLSVRSDILSDYVEELNRSCEVMQTDINSCTESELAARIENCMADKGCMIAVIDNDMWESLLGECDGIFMDSGLKTLLIEGTDNEYIFVHDLLQDTIKNISVADFAKFKGVLLEVLK